MPIPLAGSQNAEHLLVPGAVGNIEIVLDFPAAATRGVALVAHPHPLYGGSLDNKVAQTLARTMVELGYVSLRPNFRGVGASEGAHDHGGGEADDLVMLAGYLAERFGAQPLVLCGFSFGAFVQTRVAQRVTPKRMVLVGLAAGAVGGERKYATETVPADSIVIHGEHDETVPLANVLDWARPQDLPVTVAPGCDHFFHRKLHIIRAIVTNQWHDR